MDRQDVPTLGPEEATRAERHAVALRRIEERMARRLYTRGAAVAGLLVLLGVLGFFLFKAHLESLLSTAVSQAVRQATERETRPSLEKMQSEREQALQSAVASIDSTLEKRLAALQDEVEKTKALARQLAADSAAQGRATEERLQQTTSRLVEEVERRRAEILDEARRAADRSEEASRAASERTAAMLESLRADLADLGQVNAAVRAPLARKLDLLSALRLDPRAKDAEVRRSIAVLVLRELENAELVRREGLEDRAGTVLTRLAEDRRLRDDVFMEVRLRILRAVAELRRVEIARARSADPGAWERRSWILLLGALGEGSGLPTLTGIAGNRQEPEGLRVAALQALAGYQIAGTATTSGNGHGAEEEMAALAPKGGRVPVISPDRAEVRQALSTLMGIVSNRQEDPALRRTALVALGRIGNASVVSELRLVLYEEWSTLGEEILETLAAIGGPAAVGLLRDFALAPLGTKELRSRAITGLRRIGGRGALAALERIGREIGDTELKAAAERATVLLEARMGSGVSLRNAADLHLPPASR